MLIETTGMLFKIKERKIRKKRESNRDGEKISERSKYYQASSWEGEFWLKILQFFLGLTVSNLIIVFSTNPWKFDYLFRNMYCFKSKNENKRKKEKETDNNNKRNMYCFKDVIVPLNSIYGYEVKKTGYGSWNSWNCLSWQYFLSCTHSHAPSVHQLSKVSTDKTDHDLVVNLSI